MKHKRLEARVHLTWPGSLTELTLIVHARILGQESSHDVQSLIINK